MSEFELACTMQMCLLFVLETIRTGAIRVVHVIVKTEETQKLHEVCVIQCFLSWHSLTFALSGFSKQSGSHTELLVLIVRICEPLFEVVQMQTHFVDV